MSPLHVHAEVWTAYTNLHQLYTGLAMLDASGAIELTQHVEPDPRRFGVCRLRVGDATVLVDTRDRRDLLDRWIGDVDVYAKRSYQLGGYDVTGTTVVPYGFNYVVYPSSIDLRALRRWRVPGNASPIAVLGRSLRVDRFLGRPATPRTSTIRPWPLPPAGTSPSIGFHTRTWDPADARGPMEVEHRHQLNEQRAAYIRALRSAFGPRFTGGFSATPYAMEHHPDLVVGEDRTGKLQYLDGVKRITIGVATIGLGKSTGWKMAEYVAMGRAIVTEPLCSEVPGTFGAPTNHLTFSDPDECVARCQELLDDPDAVEAMAAANASYYDSYVRPDRLVARVLQHVAPDLEVP